MRPGDLKPQGAAVFGLIFTCYILSLRYYTSAAFERPQHLSITSLLLSGLLFRALKAWYKPDAVPKHGSADIAPRRRQYFWLLLGPVVARCLLFYYILRTSQCSWPGIEAFLPFFVLSCGGIALSSGASLPSSESKTAAKKWHFYRPSTATLIYTVASFAWALSVVFALGRSQNRTGAICPVGRRWEQFTPVAQLVMCLFDATIIVGFTSIRHSETEGDTSEPTDETKLCFAAAACLLLLSVPSWTVDSGLAVAANLKFVDFRDLLVDSSLVSFAVVFGWLSLLTLHPTTIALLASTFCLFGFELPYPSSRLFFTPISFRSVVASNALALALIGCLCFFSLHPRNSLRSTATATLHRSVFAGYLRLSAIFIICWALIAGPVAFPPLDAAIDALMSSAQKDAEQWGSQAKRSETLAAAVVEYQRRYGIPPPPNFDKWYAFATERKSPIIDDFNQIHEDLLPFWGLEPADIRARTSHLLDYAVLGMGGLRVRDQTLQQSPHIPGTHRWMTESMDKMIQPFVKWLPDMDIAMNLGDECQVTVPFDAMNTLKQKAASAREQVDGNKKLANSTLGSGWPAEWPNPAGEDVTEQYFLSKGGRQIYYDRIAPTCSPTSKARNIRWWDWSTACIQCAEPHSLFTQDGALVANTSLANDLCHQPDVAYLSGFVRSPAVSVMTDALFPVFSQGRVSGFSDILIPSPWNYNDKSEYKEDADMPWEGKQNKLFWRGSSSDGFAKAGVWAGFARARFVHESYQKAISQLRGAVLDISSVHVNVSFVGNVPRCDWPVDCAIELETFEHWATPALSVVNGQRQFATENRLPQGSPFDEHWKFKHLADFDGAGFSGRFLPFLQSSSLPYQVALFKTWCDERLHAWYHYVPLDIRLGPGLWAVVDFFSGRGKYSNNGGDKKASMIAKNGKDWARVALRHEDMEVYMFRLLLEWGRIVDDNRQHLGFAIE